MSMDGVALTRALYGQELDPADHLRRFYPEVNPPPYDHFVGNARPMVAKVNHGHWIASCECGAKGLPTPGCLVFMSGPGAMMGWCPRCQNGATGRGWRPVTVPDVTVRVRIEAVLRLRPHVEDRNWEQSETVDDLIRQNKEHGDPVPDFAAITIPDTSWRDRITPFTPRVRPGGLIRRMRRVLGV